MKISLLGDVQSWSELLAPLVNLIKEGCENLICIVNHFDYVIFKKRNHTNLTFHIG